MNFRERWNRPAGYGEVLCLALPLVLSTSSWSIQHFVDRMFLAWYSPVSMAAALPSGMFAFTLISFFLGTAGYANTFVAQYHGSGQPRRIGPAVWQAIYFSGLSLLLLPVFLPLARLIFQWAGHEPAVQEQEIIYFRISLLGLVASVYSSGISSYFTGLGRNWPVMWVNLGVTLVNIVLDYAMIFGNWGFPEWGIAGAAWATNIANLCGAIVFSIVVFSPRPEREHATRSGWRFDGELFGRLLRFGAPSGVQFGLDVLAFTFFIFIVGRIGTLELAATNVALQINLLSFMPMLGFGIAASTMVGQRLGRNQPEMAARATWSCFHLTFAYMGAIVVLYLLFPSLFIDPFAAKAETGMFDQVRVMAAKILYFVSIYCLFDTMNIVFSAALKGAGDTRFVMLMAITLSWILMVIPTWYFCDRGEAGIYVAWGFLTLFVIVLGLSFFLRFLAGKWKAMRVIEMPPASIIASSLPEAPAVTETEL